MLLLRMQPTVWCGLRLLMQRRFCVLEAFSFKQVVVSCIHRPGWVAGAGLQTLSCRHHEWGTMFHHIINCYP